MIPTAQLPAAWLPLTTSDGDLGPRVQWRKRVGIEPTAPGFSPEPDGFEGRAGHQTRIASTGANDHSREYDVRHRTVHGYQANLPHEETA